MPRPTPVSDYISCIIPTHNEQDRIVGVVHAALNSDLFDKVVVVDDASSDYTTWALDTLFPHHRITILKLPTRIGKSRAVAHAFSTLPRSKFVCLLDGDLIGLTARHLEALADPVMEGWAVASISRRGKGSGLWPGLDILSGERVLPWWVLDAARLDRCPPMGMEMAINDILIGNRAKIAVVKWEGVTNPTKREKYGFWVGMKEEAKMYRDLVVGPGPGLGVWAMAKQTRRLNQQVVRP